uniref:Proteasome assembly chaperone 4 n=1 Tax=Paramoeba aestuarina TaxID=180227 RepID=A0A7S4NIG1_9EUKA|eukprot:CAMPEP_0201519818 /NCGR_PEP_ID=MMETSP0161_2-20130828/10271_1 /ASSEMBLY_ACC=CAM_ASM_000251 /TAXON_ID=180227 /ORGANISM="Neoparamoeba aestuarina, Strain SoJaBio B1-5/56/2" /LENGTH=125 /DNA_ID=CAMNT_0047917971 /DNA_START=85 /DNA_END=462 /DNA_ORIENTATION=-
MDDFCWKWTADMLEMKIYFMVIPLDQNYFVWIGTEEGNLNELHMAFPPQGNETTSTTLLGSIVAVDSQGDVLANHLAKRFKCLFYVSYNVSGNVQHVHRLIQQQVFQKFKEKLEGKKEEKEKGKE